MLISLKHSISIIYNESQEFLVLIYIGSHIWITFNQPTLHTCTKHLHQLLYTLHVLFLSVVLFHNVWVMTSWDFRAVPRSATGWRHSLWQTCGKSHRRWGRGSHLWQWRTARYPIHLYSRQPEAARETGREIKREGKQQRHMKHKAHAYVYGWTTDFSRKSSHARDPIHFTFHSLAPTARMI